MQCQQTTYSGPCHKESTVRLWCPTWVSSADGPMNLCDQCYKTFDPDRNEAARSGSFHLNEDADRAFESVEIIPRHDERYKNALGMIENGQLLTERKYIGPTNSAIYIVDGTYWLHTYNHITNLGKDLDLFPALKSRCVVLS